VAKWIFSNIDETAIAIYYTFCDLFFGCALTGKPIQTNRGKQAKPSHRE